MPIISFLPAMHNIRFMMLDIALYCISKCIVTMTYELVFTPSDTKSELNPKKQMHFIDQVHANH